MHGMSGLTGVTGHPALRGGTLLIAAGGLALYQMTSLVLGPGGSRQLHLSLSVPAADADDQNESWAPSLTLALGTLAGPAQVSSTRARSGVAGGRAITPAAATPAAQPAVAPVRPVAPQPPATHPSLPPVPPIAGRPGPLPGAPQGDEAD
jgi:hypothetical protein